MLLITKENREEMIDRHYQRLGLPRTIANPGCVLPNHDLRRFPGYVGEGFPFSVLPRDRWLEIYEANKGYFLGDRLRPILQPRDQGRTNFCWGHAAVRSLEALVAWQGFKYEPLSAESVCVPITHGINRGGAIADAFKHLILAGACRQRLWPLNNINVECYTEQVKYDAASHRIFHFNAYHTFDDVMTLAFQRLPTAIGLGWWGHAVCAFDPIYLDDYEEFDSIKRADCGWGLLINNSWGADWGDNGWAVLDEEHATPDLGACTPLAINYCYSVV